MSTLLDNIDGLPNPCYILEEEKFINNLNTLSFIENASGVNVLCALKGFSMWEVFPLIMDKVSGGTASSLNEVKLISEEMKCKAHACFVVYDEAEFEEVQDLCSHITFNSINQYERYKKGFRSSIQYGLRINPGFSNVKTAKYNPCMPGSRFGISEEQMFESLPEEITGLHFHSLCESSAEDLEQAVALIEGKFGHLLHQAKWVNLGGGHHFTKKGYDLDLAVQVLSNLKANYNLEQLIVEPGEAFGWEAGVLLTRVEDVVENSGEQTAILNASFSAHMPDCLEMPYKPVVDGEVENGIEYTLGGNTCMSGDFVRGFKFKQKLKIGDLLMFQDMVHYTFVKTTTFNGVNHPSIGVWSSAKGFRLLKEFNYSSFKEKLS